MFDLPYDTEHRVPFFEDENGDGVYGFGHADTVEFAAKVNEYDSHRNGEPIDESTTRPTSPTRGRSRSVRRTSQTAIGCSPARWRTATKARSR